MLIQTDDPELVNAFVNDPDVFPFVGFPSDLTHFDMTDVMGGGSVAVVYDGDAAMMLFQRTGPTFLGIWEKHTIFRAGCRGRAAVEAGMAMLEWALCTLGARSVWSQTPESNRRARWFNRQIGMASQGMADSPQFGRVEHFVLEAG